MAALNISPPDTHANVRSQIPTHSTSSFMPATKSKGENKVYGDKEQ